MIQGNVLLCEVARPVLAFPSAVPSTSVSKYIGLKNYERVTFLIQAVNSGTGGTASAITINQATDGTGTGAKALAFSIYYANLDTTAGDTLVLTTAVSNTFSTNSTLNKNGLYVIDIKAGDLDVANSFNYLAIAMSSAAQVTMTVLSISRGGKYVDQAVLTTL